MDISCSDFPSSAFWGIFNSFKHLVQVIILDLLFIKRRSCCELPVMTNDFSNCGKVGQNPTRTNFRRKKRTLWRWKRRLLDRKKDLATTLTKFLIRGVSKSGSYCRQLKCDCLQAFAASERTVDRLGRVGFGDGERVEWTGKGLRNWPNWVRGVLSRFRGFWGSL